MSAQLHVVDRQRRLRQLRGDQLNIGTLLSDAYRQASTDETQRRLEAMRQSVKMVGIDATLRLSALLSSVTTEEAIPFWPRAWTEVELSSGTATISEEPYRVIGVQKRVEGSALSFEYDPETAVLTATGDDAGYEGAVWVVEMRLENPYIEANLAQSHALRGEHFQQYPPPHLAYVTRAIEAARQQGARPRWPVWLGQALLGVPFAYEGGTIQEYGANNGLSWARITTPQGEDTLSFVPGLSETSLKATGQTVERFEPLCSTSASASAPNAAGRSTSGPVAVSSTAPEDNTIQFATDPGFSAGQIVTIRALAQDFDRTLRVESAGAEIEVAGEVPPVQSGDSAYVVPTESEAQGATRWDVQLDTPYAEHTPTRLVRQGLKRALPPGVPANIQINTP